MNTRSFSSVSYKLFTAFAIVALVLAGLPIKPAYAATFTVTKTTDTNDGVCDADCSLREAIVAANAAAGDDIIVLNSGSTYTLSLVANGDLDIGSATSGNLTIQASGSTAAIIDGGAIDRVLDVAALGNTSLTIDTITVTNGVTPAASTTGGGIRFAGTGTLTVMNSTISNNVGIDAAGCGGGIYNNSAATINITNSTIANNTCATAGSDGGGLWKGTGGTLNITNSTFYGNSANDDGGGARINAGTATILFSTFSNNSTAGAAGNNGGGLQINGGATTATITSVILANNTPHDCEQSGGAAVTLNNTLIELDIDCGTESFNTDPGLGALANNGGPTQTMAITSGSVAFDAATSCSSLTADQRGISRPQGAACDLGAYELDNTPPSVTINQAVGQADPTNASPILFDVVFSESVTGFATGDVTLSGTAGATTAVVAGSGTTYTVTVSGMTGDGTVIADIGAGVAADAVGNGNTASSSTDNTVTYDTTGPTVTIDQAVGQADPTNASPINFTAVFSEAVAGFTTGDVVLGGTAGATTAVVTGGPTTYNVEVSGMTGDGTVTASVMAGAVTDSLGNGSSASTSTDNTVTYDTTGPTVTINQAIGQADPTNASPINFTVVFSEPATGFATGDVTLSGTAGATTATVTGGPTTYNVAVSGMTVDGTVIADIGAGVATDLAGNSSAASTSTDNTVTFDTTVPTVTIDQAVGQADPTNASPINFTVVFSEPMTGFATGDVTLSGTAGATTAVVTGGPATYNVAVSGMTGTGTVIADIGAGVATDTAGNGNTASTSTDNTVTYDGTGPAVTINQAAGQADPTNTSPINFTVVFSEPVTGFATGDVTLSGTAGATTGTVTEIAPNDGTTYNVAVSGMTADGTVIADIGAGVAMDLTNNPNAASSSTDNTVTYNTGLPDTTIDSNPPNPSNSVNATFTFSSPDVDVVGFECQLDGGGFASCTTPLNYAGLSAGSHTFEVRAVDAANNVDPTPASYTWIIDLGFPTVTGSTPTNNATVTTGPTQLVVQFSEDVINDGSTVAANNIINYLLVEDGASNTFDTLSCQGGLVADDAGIVINSATYANNGGSGPFVATLNINGGTALPIGVYRLFVCGTTSIEDLANNVLNNGLSDATVTFTVAAPPRGGGGGQAAALLPFTGFPMDAATALPVQPADKAYVSYADLWLEIPKLGVKMTIVGVKKEQTGWDVTWLNKDAGWLDGSAYPTWSGNSVITGHVWDALNQPGPFMKLKDLKYGDQIKVHAFGQVYVYEVRENFAVSPFNLSTVFKHQEKSWITLITCEDYNEISKTYNNRRIVRTVLVSVTAAK